MIEGPNGVEPDAVTVDDLAQLLRHKRLAHGFTRQAAALRAGISSCSVRERERGHGLETMVEIVNYLRLIGIRVSFRSEQGEVRDVPQTNLHDPDLPLR